MGSRGSDFGPSTNPGNAPQTNGQSTLERMALNLTGPTKPKGLLRSQSEDNLSAETPAALARRTRSMNILELGSVGFERQKEKIPVPVYNQMATNDARPERSNDSISTVIQSDEDSQRSAVIPLRPAHAVVLLNNSDRVDAAVGTTADVVGARAVGEFSGDDERRAPRTNEPSHSVPRPTTGMTRSERTYHKRFNVSSGEGSYSIEVEVQTEKLSQISPKVPHRRVGRVMQTTRGIQTDKYAKDDAPVPARPMNPLHGRGSNHPAHYQEAPEENPPRRQRTYRQAGVRPSRRYQYGPGHRQVDPPGPRSWQQAQTGTDGYDKSSSSDSDDGRRPQTSYLHESDKAATSSSSGMSPTCRLINRLVRSRSPMKNHDTRRAIDSHRLTHIHKIKKELQRLERLNNVLTGVPTYPSSSEASTSTESIVHKPIPKKYNRLQPDFPPPRPKIVRETPPSTELPNLKINPSQSCGVRNENTNTSRTELHNTGTQYSQPSIPKAVAASATVGSQNPIPLVSASSSTANVALEQKLDQLLSTFNFIADFLCLNQEAAADTSRDLPKGCSCPKKRKPKKPKPPKTPVSYFIPFNNCRGEQMYLQYGRQRSPPSLSSSEKENEDHGQGQGEVDNDGRNGRYETNKFLGRFSLQQIFQQNHPEIINRVQQREDILSKLKAEREHRVEVKRQWIRAHGPHELPSLERALEPREPRLMSGSEMRQITKKTYTKLPEVQEKKLQKQAEEEKKTNRLMSHVFANKLRQGVLKGNVNMDMSKSIIANATLLR